MEDGATRIFLNTRGKNDDEVSEELVEFLHYLEDTTDDRAGRSKSERIKRIHDRVRKVKLSEEVGVKYMQAWEEKYYDREDGKVEGKIEDILDFLEDLGVVPEKLENHIKAEEDLATLKTWVKNAARAASLEEFCKKSGLSVEEMLGSKKY